MQNIIFLAGCLMAVLLVIYCILYVLYKLVDLKEKPFLKTDQMPVLVPVPIPTKNQRGALKKLLAFIFDIRHWELAENWRFKLNEEDELIIPKGFTFNGASISRIFWAFLSPTGLLLIPGLLHDCGYKYDQIWRINSYGCPEPYQKGAGKEYWDQLFLDVGNEVNGVTLVNFIAWLAVTFSGRGAWNKHRREEMTACHRQAAA
jgi:hypothetical protein